MTHVEPPRDEKATVRVILGPGYARTESEKDATVYDFTARRVLRLDRKTEELSNDSLYATVGGRRYELDNRAFLSGVMQGAGVKNEATSLTRSEHELSMRHPENKEPKIASKTAKGEQRFSHGRSELMAWSSETIAAEPAERDAFIRFFRLKYGGHPDAVAALQKVNGIPKRIRITTGMVRETTRIEIADVQRTPDAPYAPLEGKEAAADGELAPAIAAVRTSTPESRAAKQEALLAAAVRAAGEQRYLAAILGFLEINLMTGRDLPPEFEANRAAIVADPDVRTLLTNLNPESEDAATKSLDALTRLQLAAPGKAYVTGIFKANIAGRLGRREDAFRDYQIALLANPLITGVWKDLGEHLFEAYNPYDAWRCWDIARMLAPGHPLLAEVNALEERLLKEFPEYF